MSAFGIGKLGLGAAGATALVVLVAGCGSSSSGGGTTTVAPAKNVAASSFKTVSTPTGTVLVTPKGLTIYELAGDTASNQTCDTACQAFWPPVTSGGKQVVINGHPAFTFTQDSGSGDTHGQGTKDTWGTWWVLDASGTPITSGGSTPASQPPAAKTSAPSGSGAAF